MPSTMARRERGNAIVKGSGESFPVGLFEIVAAAERLLRRGDRGFFLTRFNKIAIQGTPQMAVD